MNGRMKLTSAWLRKTAPITAPMEPKRARRQKMLQSTLRAMAWEVPEAAVVKISAVWTLALAMAGGMPRASMAEVETTP